MTESQPMTDDPTEDGRYCGSNRSPKQLAIARENGDPDPKPTCSLPAGWGTDHVGVGRCKLHGGMTPNHRAAARLKLAELTDPAIAVLGRILVDQDASEAARLRAAENILDRGGYPRSTSFNSEAAREVLKSRLSELQVPVDDEG
jgi:hypothetical protein